jgi:endogenous inhibitor of DNA gyrase (YacG/DUF329 family)
MAERLDCPICGKPVAFAPQERPASFPFCSARCRDRDFGRWANGDYVVASDPAAADTEDGQSK